MAFLSVTRRKQVDSRAHGTTDKPGATYWVAAALVMTAGAFGRRPAPPAGCAVCVPVPATQKKTTWVNSCRTDLQCYRRAACPLRDWLFHSSTDCPTCSQPISRTVLIKRRVVTECPAWKCE